MRHKSSEEQQRPNTGKQHNYKKKKNTGLHLLEHGVPRTHKRDVFLPCDCSASNATQGTVSK